MESPTSQKARLLMDLAKSIDYWTNKNLNPEFAAAYELLLFSFCAPKEENIKKENEQES